MIRGLLQRVWELPWPSRLRRISTALLYFPPVQSLLFPRYHVGVVGLFSDANGHLLLLRHTYRSEHPWGLPGGFLEHGEQPDAAIAREMREEAGANVAGVRLWRVYTEPGRPLVNVVFCGQVSAMEFTPGPEVSESGFFSPDRLPHVLPDQASLIAQWAEERASALIP